MALWSLLPDDWRAFLEAERWKELERTVDRLYADPRHTVCPPRSDVFRAFEECPLSAVKVIVLGQDPYHTPGQAHGLAFSCGTPNVIAPSLRNILTEVVRSTGQALQHRSVERGDLQRWAEQGVLLLNTVLTVNANQPRSHTGQGWEDFTYDVVHRLLSQREHLVLMRWGKDAAAVPLPAGAARRHLLLTASHPSPLSYRVSFEGCDHFARCNRYLVTHGQEAIVWT